MKPKKILKVEKRQILIDIIEKLIEKWYSQIELWRELGVHKNRISWLRLKKTTYPISLKTIDPMIEKAEVLLKALEEDKKV